MSELPLTPVILSLNLTVTFAARATLRLFAAGVRAVMVGRAPVVKLHLVTASALPAVIPLLSVATYVVSAASVRVGFSVAIRVRLL